MISFWSLFLALPRSTAMMSVKGMILTYRNIVHVDEVVQASLGTPFIRLKKIGIKFFHGVLTSQDLPGMVRYVDSHKLTENRNIG